ncbi:EpsG family protein [Escherichia coli]|uniref:EpsG family protein n=1 Tax=Escherichia coli TaxID=562 RepID=UPI003F907F77
MYIYLIVFAISIFLFYLSQRKVSGKHSFFISNIFLFSSAIPLLLLSTLRDYSVGTDTLTYNALYNSLPVSFDDFIHELGIFKESSFLILEYIIKSCNFNYTIMLLVIAIIIITLYFKAIIELSIKPELSLLLLLFLCFYIFHFNAARQGITVAIFFYSIKYIISRDFKKYLIFIFIGFSFHKTIILCLPLYFLFNIKFSLLKSVIFILTVSVLSGMINYLVNFATANVDSRYFDFANAKDEGTGVFSSSVWIIIYLLFIFVKYINKIKSSTYNLGLNLLTISVAISILSSFILHLPGSGILRLTFYFNQLAILMFPIAIYSFKNIMFRTLLFIFVVLSLSIYCYLYIYSLNGLYPYKLGII